MDPVPRNMLVVHCVVLHPEILHAPTKTSVLERDVDIQEFNLEKARLEVHRFGIMGYGKGKERILEQERAIMLGAKPPKKSYVNYKVLQEQIKEKKAAKEEEKRLVGVMVCSLLNWNGKMDAVCHSGRLETAAWRAVKTPELKDPMLSTSSS
ncbi:hypothetical protein P7K49_035485 [Saguinus oedipus]|uniref:Uncharacterized protein n=1 Tax=Saguinus oedipus TaxID=9490 RepID=A0ABQ9TMQ7_SAGOE|nr:hypothetical protein P7K49_035485 [Saguinus oedipus]